MQPIITKELIKMSFAGHPIIIDRETDQLFIDGKLKDVTERYYDMDHKKPENLLRKDKRLTSIHDKKEDTVLVITKGASGRLFFLEFTSDQYRRQRGYWLRKAYYDDGEWSG